MGPDRAFDPPRATADDGAGPLPPDASLLSAEVGARLARLSLLARRATEARRRGRRSAKRVGPGVERRDTRAYAPGDDPRRIAWPAFARLERLVVWLTHDEAPLRLALVLDTSGSMGFGSPTKLRQAARVAAGLAVVALTGEDRAAVLAGSAIGLRVQRATGGRGGIARLLATLEALRAGGRTDLGAAVAAATDAAGGRALCVVLGDLLDPAGALSAARAARARGHEVALVQVLDPSEVEPPELDGLDLEDAETGEIVTMPERGAREGYREAFASHRTEVDAGAAKLGAPVLRATTDQPFDAVVTEALRAGLLRSRGTA
jgi:uncharacterized protein (DUF58 family)